MGFGIWGVGFGVWGWGFGVYVFQLRPVIFDSTSPRRCTEDDLIRQFVSNSPASMAGSTRGMAVSA